MSKDVRVLYYDSVGSTNDLAKASDLLEAVYIANEQTAGKGSKGRRWQSNKSEGLYISFLVRPSIDPKQIPGITLMAGIVVCRVIEKYAGTAVQIKWPNDVVIGGKKAAGILTESVFGAGGIERVVCGIGINTSQTFDDELKQTAYTLNIINKQKKQELSKDLIDSFFEAYEVYFKQGLAAFMPEFRQRSALSGNVKIITPEGMIEGELDSFDDTGAIIINCNGEKMRFIAGEISVRGENGYV